MDAMLVIHEIYFVVSNKRLRKIAPLPPPPPVDGIAAVVVAVVVVVVAVVVVEFPLHDSNEFHHKCT